MIVVDSSAFIEYYRPQGNKVASQLVGEAIANDQVLVNGIIQAEIVAFAPSKREFELLTVDFSAFHWLDLTKHIFDLATELGFTMRQKGFTLPTTDLLIAATALHTQSTLYHLDKHFVVISDHTSLKQVDLR
ncbi:MAG: PIN domain-containing protein [Anaerolineales bacterium]|nr:PIN domain-containing protein [Anaerolineales bacterium]